MRRLIHQIKLLFLFFSGEDKFLIDQCDSRIKLSFLKIGLLVALIFIGSWLSATAFITHVIETYKWLSLPIGIFWALLVTNLYILLLYTISPAILPKRKVSIKKKKYAESIVPIDEDNTGFNSSMIFRIGFMVVLAIIIAQPLNVLCLSSFAENSLKSYRMEYGIKMIVAADSNLIKHESEENEDLLILRKTLKDNDTNAYNAIKNKILWDGIFLIQSTVLLDSLNKWDNFYLINKNNKCDKARITLENLIVKEMQSDGNFIESFYYFNTTNLTLQSSIIRFKNNIKSKVDNYHKLTSLLQRSDFYVKKIQLLLIENPFSWLITILICALFLVPIKWKYQIRNNSDFYKIKRKLEKDIVTDEYREFKENYAIIFKERYSTYNKKTISILLPLLEKLKQIDPVKYELLKSDLDLELSYKTITKYEYWADAPFRTKRKTQFEHLDNETNFLTKIYS